MRPETPIKPVKKNRSDDREILGETSENRDTCRVAIRPYSSHFAFFFVVFFFVAFEAVFSLAAFFAGFSSATVVVAAFLVVFFLTTFFFADLFAGTFASTVNYRKR